MIAWFTRHPVAANLLMLALLIGGWISASHMRKEVLPKLPASEITVSAYYEGRSGAQIDQELGQKIIQALEGLSGIKSVAVTSQQDMLNVTVKKQLDYDVQRLFSDVKANIESIYDWPQQAEKPQIQLADMTFDALMVQLHGDTDDHSLVKLANQVKQTLLANPAVHKIEQYGLLEYGVYIYLQPEKMQLYELSLTEVAEAIHQQSVRSRTGLLKTDNGQFLLQGQHSAESLQRLSQLVVRVCDQGQRLHLSDVARIEDGFIEGNSDIRFNQQPSIAFAVKMAAKSDVLEISRQVKQEVAQLRAQLPDNVSLTVWFNAADYVQSRLQLLTDNAWIGFVLVFVILSLFLQLRLAFWVAMGLPVAIAGTLIVLGQLGFQYTINEVTTFGFILVLGILVDDAVVVGESIYSQKQTADPQTTDPVSATIAGAKKVALPTTFGVLTTVVALLPMTQFPSETGRLFAGFAWVIIVALLFSLLESKLILPAHLRHIPLGQSQRQSRLQRWRHLPQQGLDSIRQRLYRPLLISALRYRYGMLCVAVALCVLVFGYLSLGKIRSVMFPQVPGDLLIMQVDMEPNAPQALLRQASEQIKQQRLLINQQYRQQGMAGDVIEKSMTITLEQGQILVFAEPLKRELRGQADLAAIAQQWRTAVLPLEAVDNVDVTVSLEGSGVGNQLIIQHPDASVLAEQSDTIRQWLLSQPGVRSVKDVHQASLPQLSFTLKPEAQLYGISRRMLAEQLAMGFGGLEVDRFFRDQARVKMYVSLTPEARNSRADLSQFYVFNQQGQRFPLTAVADIHAAQTAGVYYRYNGALSRNLTLDIDKDIASPADVYQRLLQTRLPDLRRQFPRLSIVPAGELEEVAESQQGLLTAFTLALLGIYILLAVPLKRYWQPLVIMAAIPLGLVGAILGHVYLGLSVSLYSWLGMLTLSGVVVNDSLLIVNRFNECREQGMALQAAAIEACLSRFRAIILTSVTTFAGLYPLLTETSEQAQYLIPAAASMAYGLLFATVISLLLIPILLVISAEIGTWLGLKPRINSQQVIPTSSTSTLTPDTTISSH